MKLHAFRTVNSSCGEQRQFTAHGGSLWDFYRVKISIALAIRSLDLFAQLIPRWDFGLVSLGLLYTFRAAGALKGWCTVRTLQTSILHKVELRKQTVNLGR